MIQKPPVSRFLLLGMGSPHDAEFSKESISQYQQARDMIHRCVNEILKDCIIHDWEAFLSQCPTDIICDSSRWFKEDFDFVKNVIFGGALITAWFALRR